MYLIALFIFTLLAILTGSALLTLFKVSIQETFQPLVVLVVGAISIVTCYAIFITQGKTVHLGFILLAIFACSIYRKFNLSSKYSPSKTSFSIKPYLFFFGITAAWFTYFYAIFNSYTYGKEGFLSLIYEDITYYALVGEQISASGNENIVGNYARLDSSFKGIAPFHYFEIYFGQLLADVFDLNALKTHIYGTNSFSIALISYSTYLFAKDYLKDKFHLAIAIFCLLSPFVSGIQTITALPEAGHYMFSLLEMNTFKYSFIFLFLWLSICLAFHQNKAFILPFLALPLLSYTLFPVVLVALSLLFLISLGYLHWQKIHKTILYYYAIGGIVLSIFLVGIYELWSLPEGLRRIDNLNNLPYLLQGDWQTSVNIVLGSFVYFHLDYIPHLLVFGAAAFVIRKKIQLKQTPKLLILLPLFFIGGTISYAILRLVTHEAFQAHSIAVAFTGNSLIILSTILIYKQLDKNKSLFILASITLLSYNAYVAIFQNNHTYNRERSGIIDLTCVENLLNHLSDTPKIATLDHRKTRHEVYPYGSWITYYRKNTLISSIAPVILSSNNDYEPEVIDNLATVLRKTSPFYQFAQQQNQKDILSLQLAFLKHYQFDFVLVEPAFKDNTGLLNQLELIASCEAGHLYRPK